MVSLQEVSKLLLGLDSLRGCNAHPLATFAARKLLALLVGEPDRYAAGAFSRFDNTPFSAYLASIKQLVAYKYLSYGYNPSRGLTRKTPLHLLLRKIYLFNTRDKKRETKTDSSKAASRQHHSAY